jgi:DNA-binding NarL/FixJ family response regulator
MTIYLLEDDPVYADFIIKALKVDPANQIRHYGTGEEFLKAVETKLPDVSLLDYKLPGMTGIEVFELIKPRIKSTNKVVLLSSLDDGNMVLNFIQRGVRDYVIKDENVVDSLMAIISGNEEDYYMFS